MMPKMDGFSAIHNLKLLAETAEIPIFAITGLTSTEAQERAFELGAIRYFTKPLNLKALVQAIKEELASLSTATLDEVGGEAIT